jgi:hypothetical protein
VGALDARLPWSAESLRSAAWAGLPDSMPRAALLSIHARVADTQPSAWEDPSLVQLWGPRFSAYVVAAPDIAVFTLGRLPTEAAGLRRAEGTAARLSAFMGDRRMTYGEAGRALGVNPNMLRYAAPTGTVLMRWEGARQPVIWIVPAPEMDAAEARLELARRYLHTFGTGTPIGYTSWAGLKAPRGRPVFDALAPELTPVRTPVGEAWILTADEAALQARERPTAPARLLPSGDTYFLLWGVDRELLVPEPRTRAQLWTSRVWPGAVLVAGEIVGTWRRAEADVTIRVWRRLTPAERAAVEAEAEALPLPGLARPIRVAWDD